MSAQIPVSVIIPTYNRAALVKEAVASVLAQTWREFELIVVDDGSTDDTATALAPYADQLRLIRRESTGGVAAARNAGVAAAKGEWLALLDSDDLWLPEKLARQMAFLAEHPESQICQTEETWVRRGVRVNQPLTHRKIGGRIFFASLERCMVSPSATVLHRHLFEEHGGFDEELPAAEDYDLWLRLSWRYEVGLLPEPLIVKRGGHAGQLSGLWGIDRYRIRALTKLLKEPGLPAPEAAAARRVLARKCAIYAQGCEKRGKIREAGVYRELGKDALRAGSLESGPMEAAPAFPWTEESCEAL